MPGYVDLHTHVLPALDDGAPDAATTGRILELLKEGGFDHVCATPHQKAAQFLPSQEQIQAAFEEAQGICAAISGLTLLLGAENYWDDVFFERARTRQIPCYTGGKAFLFEVPPHALPARFEEELFAQRARGLLPVLAHPERYPDLANDLDRARAIGRTAALVVDLPAIAGAHGPRHARGARALVAEGIAHAVATDVHAIDDVMAAADGMTWIKRRLGAVRLAALLEDAPRRILRGQLPE